ncbi:DUF724 domain-containing protein 3-like isoform X2 [Durio zibethinus]|uniref:DUF724 domain-containing protein 3-like isoform X2 n=1 Tax=Durio zibethinus TaxID=66656 RepID=A0A6P5WV61_DURZI|nr:DUF724 domain-containing protein 3-like isoform X2 [Durio zibethinus]
MPPKRKPTTAPATDDPPHLQPGSQVEISSNDPGFRGSWFTGSIIKRASLRNPNKFVVQYTLLFQDEAGTKPLKETIDAVDIRPLAPRERARKFKFGEEVDAFHNDGWWEGVITKELENGNFHVYFKRSKEQLEFGEDQLRLHREWVNGSWTPPLEEDEQVEEKVQTEKDLKSNKIVTQEKLGCDNGTSKEKLKSDKAGSGEKLESGKTTDKKFNEGEHVEVTSDEDGFEGAWFAATIVKAVGKDRYLIQYESLRTEDDTDFLKEEFDILHIRPYPPEVVVADRFKKLDEVDALYNDGWWVGVISKVLSDSKYEVYFKNTKEKMKFNDSELRLHQDWIDGKWVAASQALKS